MSTLPIKYLGIPLNGRSLNSNECCVLTQRLTSRISSWHNRFLSRAGRVVLIKSVIQSILVYWSRVFILPVKVLREVNSICANFLWKGASDKPGGHRISWETVCLPREEGGLGVKCLRTMNKALVINQLWEINDKDNLWNGWLRHYWMKGTNWWDVSAHSQSWVIKRLEKSRELLTNHVVTKSEGISWNGKGNNFSAKNMYDSMRKYATRPDWIELVWNPISRPRDEFHAWLVFSDRLPTRDRLFNLDIGDSRVCELCKIDAENNRHLFFECPISNDVLNGVCAKFKCMDIPKRLQMMAAWFKTKNKTRLKTKMQAMITTTVMYEIWKMRNKSIFENTPPSTITSINYVVELLKRRIGSLNPRNLNSRDVEWLKSINIILMAV